MSSAHRMVKEVVYHVAPDDSVIGPVERDTAHSRGLLHRSGVVFVQRLDKRLIVQRRSPSKQIFPGLYDCSSSFHVVYGETYERAARRELEEETGLVAELRWLGKFSHHDPPENQIVAVFACTSDDPLRLDETESAEVRPLTFHEVDVLVSSGSVTPWFRDGWKLAKGKI